MPLSSGSFEISFILFWAFMFYYIAREEGDALFVKENETFCKGLEATLYYS